MSTDDHMSAGHDCGADAAAYALGALDPEEADAFRQHLETCVVCREEVAAFQRVGEGLAASAPQFPAPRRLRRRVLHAVREDARSRTVASPRAPVGRLGTAWGVPQAAVALVVTLVLAGAAFGVLEALSGGSSGSRVVTAKVLGLPGSAHLRISGGHAELVVRRFPPPPAGRIYEVWLKRGTGPPIATRALFSVTANGSGDIGVPGGLNQVSQMMVTQEPAGGSLKPTSPPVILAQLS